MIVNQKDYNGFTKKRDREIITLLNKGESSVDIARKFMISKETVNNIKIKNNIKTKPKSRSTKKDFVISRMHAFLGNLIQIYRLENQISIRDFSLIIGISYRKLAEIERGSYDFSLTELNLICSKLELELNIHLLGDENAGELQPENISIGSSSLPYFSGEIT